MVVLDTDCLTLLERSDSPQTLRLQTRLGELGDDAAATTIISFEEQMRGWLAYLGRSPKLANQIEAYRRLKPQLDNYSKIHVLTFDSQAALEFQRLRNARVRVGTMDLKIAAIVIVHGATLLTRNLRDFQRVPGLNVEDWT